MGLPGPMPGSAYPSIEIGQANPDCHIPEVNLLIRPEVIVDIRESIKLGACRQLMYRDNIGANNWQIWRIIGPSRSSSCHHDSALWNNAE